MYLTVVISYIICISANARCRTNHFWDTWPGARQFSFFFLVPSTTHIELYPLCGYTTHQIQCMYILLLLLFALAMIMYNRICLQILVSFYIFLHLDVLEIVRGTARQRIKLSECNENERRKKCFAAALLHLKLATVLPDQPLNVYYKVKPT